MADITIQRNVNASLKTRYGSAFTSATAGSTGDNTAVTGAAIDRLDASTGSLALNAQLNVVFSTVLASGATLSLKTVAVDHSPDNSTWTTGYLTFSDPGVVATGASGGSTVTGVTSLTADLSSAYRYVRFNFTPDLSAANTDTASLIGVGVLAGFDRLPA